MMIETHKTENGIEGLKSGNSSMEIVVSGQTEANELYNNNNNGCMVVSGENCGGGRRSTRSNRRGLKVPPFLNKVYELVNDPKTDATISWTCDGTRFTVWDHHMFTKHILPTYFRHDNFSSFVYQLNNYGFKKTSWDNWEYENKCFQQGKEYMLLNIKRKNQISPATRRKRAVKSSLNLDDSVFESQLETEKFDHNHLKLEVQNLESKQKLMENELSKTKMQIESLFRQQKIVLSIVSAFVPQYARQMQQEGEREAAELEKNAAENMENDNQVEHMEADHNTCQQNNLYFPDNPVENIGDCSLLEKLMQMDENHEPEGELANQHSNIVMELEDLMSPAELGGYIEFMSQVEFDQETKPAI